MTSFISRVRLAGWAGLVALATGCVEQYVPDVLPAATSLLVVDGFINGNGRTRIQLSRSIDPTATIAPPQVRGASVLIVDDLNQRYVVRESPTYGQPYTSDSLQLDPARRYHLRVVLGTAASSPAYESDPLPLKATPPIDRLAWRLEDDHIKFNLSTHDPRQQSRYYRWSLTETWQFNSAYYSELEYNPVTMAVESRTTPIYTCWRTERVSAIKQVTSSQLSQDAVSNLELLSQTAWAERFKIRYSLLVSQYAETPEEYAYYELLRKNTEAIGTVNDPLPAQLTGNVHRVGYASEPVLGFVSVHTVQQQRLFVNRADLPFRPDADFASPYSTCSTMKELFRGRPDSIYVLQYPNTNMFRSPAFSVPIRLLYWVSTNDPGGGSIRQAYLGSTAACVDCRTRGVNSPPAFW